MKKDLSAAAAILGARGGKAGTGSAKRRAIEHYREMAKKSAASRLRKTQERREREGKK